VVSTLLVTVLELLSLLVLHHFGSSFNVIPSGPVGLAFSLLYQFIYIVPATYHFRVFGVAFSNKSFVYALALQVNRPPNFKRTMRLYLFRHCVSLHLANHGQVPWPRHLGFPLGPSIDLTLPVSKATDFLHGLFG
jgi:hypothetical protein